MIRLLKNAASALIVLLLLTGLSPFVWAISASALEIDDTTAKSTTSQAAGIGLSEAAALETDNSGRMASKADLTIMRASYYTAYPLEDKEVPLAAQQPGESWSLGNSLLSAVGLVETLIAIGYFLYRNRQESLNLLGSDFMLKVLSLFFVVIAIIGTSITSDFARAVVIFDEMSLLIALLFGIQQALLFGVKKTKTLDPIDEKRDKRFRAKRRFES
jgi:hypothetical protein